MSRYAIQKDGRITFKRRTIGRYDPLTGKILEDVLVSWQARAYVKRLIAAQTNGKEAMNEEHTQDAMEDKDMPPEEAVSVKTEDPKQPMEPSPSPQEVPLAPEMDPRLGDKTPAYMQWMAKFHPEKFKKQYAGRKVMGVRMPFAIDEPKVPESKPLAPLEGDLPEDAMAKEPKEEWK